MDGGGTYNPRTVEEVFRDFKGRRAGMIKALTTGACFSFQFSILFMCFFFSLLLFFVLIAIFLCYFIFGFADVEEFYQQCDPGLGFIFLSLSLSLFFRKNKILCIFI